MSPLGPPSAEGSAYITGPLPELPRRPPETRESVTMPPPVLTVPSRWESETRIVPPPVESSASPRRSDNLRSPPPVWPRKVPSTPSIVRPPPDESRWTSKRRGTRSSKWCELEWERREVVVHERRRTPSASRSIAARVAGRSSLSRLPRSSTRGWSQPRMVTVAPVSRSRSSRPPGPASSEHSNEAPPSVRQPGTARGSLAAARARVMTPAPESSPKVAASAPETPRRPRSLPSAPRATAVSPAKGTSTRATATAAARRAPRPGERRGAVSSSTASRRPSSVEGRAMPIASAEPPRRSARAPRATSRSCAAYSAAGVPLASTRSSQACSPSRRSRRSAIQAPGWNQ